MATKDTVKNFITTSVGLRYWYLTRRNGRYKVSKAKFKEYATVYGEIYTLLVKDKNSVLAALKELSQDKLPSNILSCVQDFSILLQTVIFFSEATSQTVPPSIFEELFAFIKSVFEDAGVANINDYLKKNSLKVTQNFADLCAFNGLKVDSSLISKPVVVPAPPTVWVGIQSWQNKQITPNENFSSQLFSLPYVIPYIECFFTYNDNDKLIAKTRAEALRDRVVETRDTLRQYHPNTPFNWAYWPHRYGIDGFAGTDDKLFYHKDDRLASGSNVVFTAKGRALFKEKTKEFFGYVKPLLKAAGIPDPIFLDADYESGCGHVMATQDWVDCGKWHSMIMADPRAKTELIDGVQTYEQFIHNLKDLDGKPVPESELFMFIYDSSEKACKRSNVYITLTNLIVDYGLSDCLYSTAKEIWPNVLCGNWATMASTRTKLVNGWRFKESPIDAGPNFKGMQITPLYGNPTMDKLFWPVGMGFNTFNEQLFRFGIDKNAFTDKDALARKIHTSFFEYFASGMNEACPNGKKAISISWSGEGSWYGPNVFIDPEAFPPEYIGAVLDYKAHPEIFDEFYASCKRNNISVIEVFAQDTNKSACDDMYTAFKKFQG